MVMNSDGGPRTVLAIRLSSAFYTIKDTAGQVAHPL